MSKAPAGSVLVAVASWLRSPQFRARFLELSRQTERWMHEQPGFLRYELFETEAGWMDTMLWRSRLEAEAANTSFAASQIAAEFAEIVEPDHRGYLGSSIALEQPANR